MWNYMIIDVYKRQAVSLPCRILSTGSLIKVMPCCSQKCIWRLVTVLMLAVTPREGRDGCSKMCIRDRIGFGCTVPGVMASRTLPSERDRKMTILLTPFMSCTAKHPIYAFFTAAFFPQHGALVMICLLYTSRCV